MNRIGLAAFGWLVPGGSYLLLRRYRQAATFAVLVTATFGGGLLLGGTSSWPQPTELAGADGFTALAFRALALTKAIAGGPYLVAGLFDGVTFLAGRLHEYGTALLLMAGLLNLLAISTAIDLEKEAAR